MSQESTPQEIAKVNDNIRVSIPFVLQPHRVVCTAGVSALGEEDVMTLFKLIRSFSDFSEDNDPHLEHDFGKVTFKDQDYFFKFDYYDDDFTYFKENGNRVLTIMRADEY